MDASAPSGRGNGIKAALDTIVAPKEAFEELRTAPTWGWALVFVLVLLAVGYWLQRPAQLHASLGTMQHLFASNSFFASMSDAQKADMIQRATHPTALQTVLALVMTAISVFVGVLLNAAILWVGNLAARGKAGFALLWAGSMNIAVPTFGLSYAVLGVICTILGPDRFATTPDILRALPGFATLFPSASGFLGMTLVAINIFTLWGFFLNVLMLRTAAGLKGAGAWIAPLVILLGGALASGAFSGFYGR